MSATAFRIWTCDICRKTAQTGSELRPADWWSINFTAVRGTSTVACDRAIDLCPDCGPTEEKRGPMAVRLDLRRMVRAVVTCLSKGPR